MSDIKEKSIFVSEEWLNATENYWLADTSNDVYEPYTTDLKELFREYQKKYGRCCGRIYNNNEKPIGWRFEKQQEYEDTKEKFVLETYITFHNSKPAHKTIWDYKEI